MDELFHNGAFRDKLGETRADDHVCQDGQDVIHASVCGGREAMIYRPLCLSHNSHVQFLGFSPSFMVVLNALNDQFRYLNQTVELG